MLICVAILYYPSFLKATQVIKKNKKSVFKWLTPCAKGAIIKVSKREQRREVIGVQVNELKSELVKKGLTIEKLSEMAGISRSAMFKKLHGKTEFKLSEIMTIKKILSLEDDRFQAIFFGR